MSTLGRVSPICAWLALMMLLNGCGKGERFPLAPVSGVVMLDGQPLSDARVAFEPIAVNGAVLAGPGSYGKTDAAGCYNLSTSTNARGAVVGEHQVTISTAVMPPRGSSANDDVQPSKEKVPAKYRDGREPIQFTVPVEGAAQADFFLTSANPKE